MSVLYIMGNAGWITILPAAYYAVDIFFFIGGFLSCVIILEKMEKSEKSKTLSP
jgi:peptidoglycan/LPS O-acetylase OafA/YrhL